MDAVKVEIFLTYKLKLYITEVMWFDSKKEKKRKEGVIHGGMENLK